MASFPTLRKIGIRFLPDPDGSIEKEELLSFDVPLLLEKLPKPCLPLREGGSGDEASKPDTVVLGDLIQHADGRSVPEENSLGIHCH